MKFAILSLLAIGAVAAACSSSREGFVDPVKPPSDFQNDAGAIVTPDADTQCASSERKAESVPLAMLVLIDRSGSMAGEKWEAATKAVRAFADRSEVVGMRMGLQFFPPLNTGDECSPTLYEGLPVPIAPLPDNVIPIQQKLAATD